MTYTLTVDPAAIREAAAIHAWREQDKKGSGERFLEALHDCYDDIRERPFGHQIRRAPFRHAMIGRFKYRLVYAVVGSEVKVVQIRHTSRRPSKRFGP